MDFSVSDFNVRLRTIRIRELIVAFVVAFILTINNFYFEKLYF